MAEEVKREEVNSVFIERIASSMFASWYPKIAPLKLTYKSKIIPLSQSFVNTYLKADGMH